MPSTEQAEIQLPHFQTDQIIIHTEGLSKKFGNEVAVYDVTFQIPRGTIFGFIGPSGSGKTTTIRLLTGVYEPTQGQVTVLGRAPIHFTQSTREKIGYMPQLFVLYPELTVWENLNFAASIYGMGYRRNKRLNELLQFVDLAEHKHKPARKISGGMQRRLSLAATLIHDPELLFLDEPTAGIDPVLRLKFWDHFRNLKQNGATLLITTQYVSEAAYCDLVGVMAEGRLLMVETPEDLRRRAFGGEIVELKTTERLDYKTVLLMANLAFVQNQKVTRTNETGLRVIVDEASTAMPALLTWCKEHDIGVESIEEHLPPFDDVFVELVKREPENV